MSPEFPRCLLRNADVYRASAIQRRINHFYDLRHSRAQVHIQQWGNSREQEQLGTYGARQRPDAMLRVILELLDEMVTVEEGKVCQTILDMYNRDAIVVEPAGGMTVAVLDQFKDEILGKNVVCLISGSNNDITRTEEIKERALLYAGLKHYFVVQFPQRAGALKEFISNVLGPEDNITHFEYSKKHNRNSGPAVVGIELLNAESLQPLQDRMSQNGFVNRYLNDQPDLFELMV